MERHILLMPLSLHQKDGHNRLYVFRAQKLLLQHSGLFFAPLALVVVNDDSARCKKMAAMAIKALLAQLDLNHQNTLYALVNTWLNAEKVHMVLSFCWLMLVNLSLEIKTFSVPPQTSMRRLGAQVCGLFVEVEEGKFASRLDDLLPLLEKEINPDNYEDVRQHFTHPC